MIAVLSALFLLVPGTLAGDTVPRREPPFEPAILATAYADSTTADAVRRARERLLQTDQSIHDYQALAQERVSVGVSTMRRERLLYRRESAARIHWQRTGAVEIEALGAREVIPIASPDASAPKNLRGAFSHLVFDPSNHLLFSGPDEKSNIRHPLVRGSERDYRFALGDTTRLRLPDGRTIQLLELRLTPRRSDPRLVTGSLWLDRESYAVVQAVVRLARPFDLERDADDPDDKKDLRWVPGILKPFRADLEYLTIEYGLWEMRWWLPRLVALEGYGQAGSLLRVPVRYELAYSDYRVEGDTLLAPVAEAALVGDTVPRKKCREVGCWCSRGRCRPAVIHLPADTASLLASEYLPPSIYDERTPLVDESTLRDLTALLSRAESPVEFVGPRVRWGLGKPELLRYNRVEGLSFGVATEVGYGAWSADQTVRIPSAELKVPGFEFGVGWENGRSRARLGAYRRLTAVDPAARPFSLTNSFAALLMAHDDGDYYRALGLDLSGGPAPGRPAGLSWRLYAERQHPVDVNTNASLRRLWDKDVTFRPNLAADTADLLGAALALRVGGGLNPASFRWAAALALEGASGTFRFLRPAATLTLATPLPGRLTALLEGSAGTSLGELPLQKEYPLGGSATLRGYAPLTARGSSFWRARAEVGTRAPLARFALFSDLGWAGERDAFPGNVPLLSAGAGVSFLDGLVRIDLARALRSPTGWRLVASSDLGL
jgi:hypothetical protein